MLVARRGIVVKNEAYGYAAKYADDRFTPLQNPVPMENNTIFDLASVSKLFTSTAAIQLYDKKLFKLDDPVAKYIPEFTANGVYTDFNFITLGALVERVSRNLNHALDTSYWETQGLKSLLVRYLELRQPFGTA